MDIQKNAPLTPKGREAMVWNMIERGLTEAAAALQLNVTAKTEAKWVNRLRERAVEGLRDRSLRPLFIAKPNLCRHMHRSRGVAPAAP
ncbi:hypothetical protein IVB24_09200 [Bradyrhizobium sp. 192]|nr:hypothetical protein IVB24_09200 [Bradyrhizobium sp. 192]